MERATFSGSRGVTPAMDTDQHTTFANIAGRVGCLSVAIAAISGDLGDIAAGANEQLTSYSDLEKRIGTMVDDSHDVVRAASDAHDVSAASFETLERMSGELASMMAEVSELTDEVSRITTNLGRVEQTLKRVEKASDLISSIARQTSLLSLNALIEAARAGQHGKSFMVVANEVKGLSSRVSVAAADIGATITEMNTDLAGLVAEAGSSSNRATGIRSQIRDLGSRIEVMPDTLRRVHGAQKSIVASAQTIETSLGGTQDAITALTQSAHATAGSLSQANDRLEELTDNTEALTGMTAQLGIRTVDTPFIEAVQAAADTVSDLFNDAVDKGHIQLSQLFDEGYSVIPGTDPVQHMTAFTRFTDLVLPPVQEAILGLSPLVVFCAAVDRNGYLPTHNRKFSEPQHNGDPAWNAQHCRNRRIFNDRVGLGAGKSTQPFLLQAYRRDMGNGVFIMMKDVSAPISVKGRHWGGLRLAYRNE